MLRLVVFLFFLLPIAICQAQLLESLLLADSNLIVRKVMANPDKYRVQIIYTETNPVNSQKLIVNSQSSLTTHYFRNNPNEYFFPASLVKFPVSVLALEKLNSLSLFGITPFTPFMPLSDFQCKKMKFNSFNILPQSASDLLKKVFVYSDNEAYNYLYELCGQAFIQERMQEMGFGNARIVEKIANCSGENNRMTGPIAFYHEQELFHIEGRQTNANHLVPPAIDTRLGKGYLWGGKYIPAPKDFANANFVPLKDFHQMQIALHMPLAVPVDKRFKISEAARELVRQSMCTLPSQYFADTLKKPFLDNYVKYLFGQTDTIPSHFKIYNKVGLAYGFASDCSYFEDSKNNIRFFLSAMIYTNENEILNDGKYEYYTIGIPFLRRLGQIVYQYELKKK